MQTTARNAPVSTMARRLCVGACLVFVAMAALAHLASFIYRPAVSFLLWPALGLGFASALVAKFVASAEKARRKRVQAGDDVASSSPSTRDGASSNAAGMFVLLVLFPYFVYWGGQTAPKGERAVVAGKCTVVQSGKVKWTGPEERCAAFDDARDRTLSVIAILFALHAAEAMAGLFAGSQKDA
jgi:hypothetical protein